MRAGILTHNLNIRKILLKFIFEDIDDMFIGDYLFIHNLLIVKKDGKEYRFLIEKRDRNEVLKMYQQNRKL